MKVKLSDIFCGVASVVIVVVLASCMDDKGVEGPAGKIMMVNAATGVEDGLEIQLNGRKANISDVPYTGNTGYLTVNNGDYDLIISESGADAIYHDPKLEIESGNSYSLFVFGSDSVKAFQVEDNLGDTSNTKARLRFFNFTENTPMLNVSTSTGVSIVPIFPNRSIETFASAIEHSAFITVDEGTYAIKLVNSFNTEILLDSMELALEAGHSYTLFASGMPESPDTPLKLTLITNN